MRKITRAEFNKVVESNCGMSSVRIRRKHLSRYKKQSAQYTVTGLTVLTSSNNLLSCSDAGHWLFSGRKWIDPADLDGRTMLDLHYHNLSILFPAFAAACSRDRLVDAVAGIIDRWSHHSSAATAGDGDPAIADSTHGGPAKYDVWPTMAIWPEASSDGTPSSSEADTQSADWPASGWSDPSALWLPAAGRCHSSSVAAAGDNTGFCEAFGGSIPWS
jgi:hypothetical protein